MKQENLNHSLIINEDSLEEVFHLYFDELCTFLGYYSKDTQLIEDCLQDIFLKLWEDRARVNIFHMKTYLYQAARNRVLNSLRNQLNRSAGLEKWFQEEMVRQHTEECVNREEFSIFYAEAIDALPDKCRQIYQYCKGAKKSYKDVAAELQVSVKTVENQMGIASKKIRSYILNRYQSGNPSIPLVAIALQSTALYYYL